VNRADLGIAVRKVPFEPSPNDRSNTQNPELQKYLSELARRVWGTVPAADRDSFLDEARNHLEQAVRYFQEKGESSSEATRLAIARYGSAKEIAEEFMASWFQYQSPTPLSKHFGRANLVAYGWFQILEVFFFVILQLNVYLPSESAYHVPFGANMAPAKIRSVWPAPLPFPDLDPRFFMVVALPVLAPIIAGLIVGRMVPTKAAVAVYRGLTPLILFSFLIGALLLPVTDGILFAMLQLVYWLPVGCLSAHVTSTWLRSRRNRAYDEWIRSQVVNVATS
jgi:hypothetical protein